MDYHQTQLEGLFRIEEDLHPRRGVIISYAGKEDLAIAFDSAIARREWQGKWPPPEDVFMRGALISMSGLSAHKHGLAVYEASGDAATFWESVRSRVQRAAKCMYTDLRLGLHRSDSWEQRSTDEIIRILSAAGGSMEPFSDEVTWCKDPSHSHYYFYELAQKARREAADALLAEFVPAPLAPEGAPEQLSPQAAPLESKTIVLPAPPPWPDWVGTLCTDGAPSESGVPLSRKRPACAPAREGAAQRARPIRASLPEGRKTWDPGGG